MIGRGIRVSFCRWSSDDFCCDVYCYESALGGFDTHVASHKYLGDIPKLPDITTVTNEEFLESYQKQTEFLKTAQVAPLGLPFDGECFNDETISELKERLVKLKECGYRIPDYVFQTIDDEIVELGLLAVMEVDK
jgi:hypothetical protein